RSLATFGETAVAPLVAALSSSDNVRSYWAGQALLLVGRPAVKPLAALVLQADAASARRAARLLGDLGDPTAAAPLRQALQQKPDPEFQFAARTALQRLSEGQTAGAG